MINSLKDLKHLLALCRKQGVTELKLGDVQFKLGDLPPEPRRHDSDVESDDLLDPLAGFPTGELTPEQLMFYSAGGLPKDDPILNQGEPQ